MTNKSIKNFLLISIVIFIIFGVAFLFIFRQINKNIKITQKLNLDLYEEILRREEIKDFNTSFKLIEQEKSLFETHFVVRSNIVPFLNKIESMAKSSETKVEVSNIEISNDNTELIVRMETIGTFSGIYKFINLLENSIYELEFNSVRMYKDIVDDMSIKKNNKNLWQADFTIKLISFI